MKTNDGDMLKSPKKQETDSCFFGLFSPRATSVLLPTLLRIYQWSRPLLTGTAVQFNATYSKQTTEEFLIRARTHIRQTRICAKMSEEMKEEMSELKALR
jgi:hypothetical protein